MDWIKDREDDGLPAMDVFNEVQKLIQKYDN